MGRGRSAEVNSTRKSTDLVASSPDSPERTRRNADRSGMVGDLSGGFASAVVAITGNLAAGVIAFSPLGPEYVGAAVMAGMLSSIVAGLLASLLGGAPGMISGPKATTSTAFAALLGQLIAAGQFDLASAEEVRVLLTLAFTAVLMSGSVQLLLGSFRVGALVKFIPYTVVAGIRNCTAILLIYAQIWTFLGVPRQSVGALLADLGAVQPLTFIVATATAATAWGGGKLIRKALVAPLALLVGTVLYYALAALPGDVALGPVLGAVPALVPTPEYLGDLFGLMRSGGIIGYLPILISGALAIAVLDSLSALITLVAFQSVAQRRFDANRQLIGQGIGTAVGAAFGGLSTSGIFARAAVNHQAGGRSSLSGVANGLAVLILILVLAGPLAFIPKAAIAGLIVVIAVGLFDPWSLVLMKEALGPGQRRRRGVLLDVGVIGLVITVGVVVNLIAAVVAGVLLSILIFVGQMSRSPIRRVRIGRSVRSKVRRQPRLAALLERHGDRVALVELEGTVFFGSSDAVARRVETLADEGADFILLDLRRVRRIDATGFRVLGQTHDQLRKRGVNVGFTFVTRREDAEIEDGLRRTGGVPPASCFETTDEGLESFEEQLLGQLDAGDGGARVWTIQDFASDMDLNEKEAGALSPYLNERHYGTGEVVCGRGDEGDSMFFVSAGSADIVIRVSERGRTRRLATVTAGTIFGEMSLLDRQPRSADVVAREPLVCFELTAESFDHLREQHHAIGVELLAALATLLGGRLREANQLISELDT